MTAQPSSDSTVASTDANKPAPKFIEIVVADGVGSVRLCRPEVRNALSPEMMGEIAAALEDLDRREDVRAILIAGSERAFAAGGDLKGMVDRPLHTVLTQTANGFWSRVGSIATPLVAAVSGFALGGGCELALSCDLIVAAECAVFAQAEITVGIVPGGGGAQRLARAIGKQRAMEMVLTGRRITATEAYELGFVNAVVPDDSWRDAARELALQIAAKPPLAAMLAKRAVLAAEEAPLAAAMSFERRLYELTMATEDRREGMSAFLERREPRWRGR